jgi:succinate dehydrogenase / fumarate reductase, flavoprotein subunit
VEPLGHLRTKHALHVLTRRPRKRTQFPRRLLQNDARAGVQYFSEGLPWPFHATRMLDFGSSLLDLAVFRETQAGHRVFMDFNRNPLPVPGDAGFDLDRLDEDVGSYLKNSGALLDNPLDRLRKMNPLSIELYKRHKYDITRDPLEFAINNQHMNGGLAVDTWAQTNLEGCYAIGEAAGTHGVTRPGGAALNAGQVFGTRCAEHIAAERRVCRATASERDLVEQAVARTLDVLRADSSLTISSIRKDIQDRMSNHAAIVCVASGVKASLAAARSLNESIRQQGIAFDGAYEAARALQWQQPALLSEAVLTALAFYVERGGGSRGLALSALRREIARLRLAPGRSRTSASFRNASRIRPNRVSSASKPENSSARPAPFVVVTATIGPSSSANGPIS